MLRLSKASLTKKRLMLRLTNEEMKEAGVTQIGLRGSSPGSPREVKE